MLSIICLCYQKAYWFYLLHDRDQRKVQQTKVISLSCVCVCVCVCGCVCVCVCVSNFAALLRRALLVDALVETSQLDKPNHRIKVGFIEGVTVLICNVFLNIITLHYLRQSIQERSKLNLWKTAEQTIHLETF